MVVLNNEMNLHSMLVTPAFSDFCQIYEVEAVCNHISCNLTL